MTDKPILSPDRPNGEFPKLPMPVLASSPSSRDVRAERLALASRSPSWHEGNGVARRRALGDMLETWLTDLWHVATRTSEARPIPRPATAENREKGALRGVALAAVGGLARGDAGPASDLDLVLLHDGYAMDAAEVAALADRMWYPVWDAGIRLDHSVRTPAQCRQIGGQDLAAGIGLLDLRVIAGDAELVAATRARLLEDWRAAARRRLPELIRVLDERVERFGDAAFLLEPDLKNSRGGLRDVTVLRALTASWLADRPHGNVDEAARVLLDVRDALHVVTGKAADVLLMAEQDTVAGLIGADDADDLLTQTAGAARAIGYAVDVTVRRARQAVPRRRTGPRRPRLNPLGDGLVEHDGEVVLGLGARPEKDPVLAVRAAATAARRGFPLSPVTVAHLAQASELLPRPWSSSAREAFLELLAAGPAMVGVWESLDDAGLIERWIPGWTAIRFRPQRTPVHRYTVDRHLVEAVVQCAPLVRDVERPDLLLVAALLHDIGKVAGATDHSAVGAPIARRAAEVMGFESGDVEVIHRLVREHLTLVDLATRRDPDDPRTVEALVAAVEGRSEVLNLLRALTEADALATGPAAWTAWRARLVDDLTARARTMLAEGQVPTPAPLSAQETALLEAARSSDAPQIATSEMDGMHVVTVVAPDRLGLFADIAGLLAAHGLTVRSALVRTVAGMAVDTWWVGSRHGDQVEASSLLISLRRLTAGDATILDRLVRRDAEYRPTKTAPAHPRAVVVPGASGKATVVEVRAADRPGLLHAVGRALAELRVDVRSAHVATHAGQAVDTLYLAEVSGGPLTPARVARVIAAAVDAGHIPSSVLAK
ncbi:MAG: [protein-PII] uridylyltransferase [Actinomycetota bacterium]